MKYFALTLFVFFIVLGCQSETKTPKEQVPKVLDWNKAASEQNLKIGDTMTVEGIAYNLFDYNYFDGLVSLDRDNSGFNVTLPRLVRSNLDELSIPLYNPDNPDVESNPNVPIGSVVCTVHNVQHNEHLTEGSELNKLYPKEIMLKIVEEKYSMSVAKRRIMRSVESGGGPYSNVGALVSDRRLSEHLILQHKFQVTGTIQGFQRRKLRGVSLLCVDIDLGINVSDLIVIESQKVHEKLDNTSEK